VTPALADAVALRTVVPIALLIGAGVASLVLLSSLGSALTLNLWLLVLA